MLIPRYNLCREEKAEQRDDMPAPRRPHLPRLVGAVSPQVAVAHPKPAVRPQRAQPERQLKVRGRGGVVLALVRGARERALRARGAVVGAGPGGLVVGGVTGDVTQGTPQLGVIGCNLLGAITGGCVMEERAQAVS